VDVTGGFGSLEVSGVRFQVSVEVSGVRFQVSAYPLTDSLKMIFDGMMFHKEF
jgi:hypothetical protein